MAIFLFYGQEEFLIEKEIKKLKNELLDVSFISMAYKIFDNPPFNVLIECVQSPPLMFGSTLNIINIDKYLTGSKISIDDKQLAVLDDSLSNISPMVNIVFLCKIPRNENKKPDSRKKLYKILSKYSQVREFPQFRTYQKELNSQIAGMAKEKGLVFNNESIAFFIEQIGSNLTLIDSELEKLKTAVYPEKNINKELIKKYCVSSEDVFVLADLIISANKNEILKQYNLLTEKRHPLEIFSVLQSNIQRFIFIKNYEKRMTAKDMALKLKLHEYIVMKTKEKLNRTSLDRLIKIRENLIEAEYKLKTGQTLNGEMVLELALLC
ncbi:MAG: DNA polymerase III subunit delta [Candidatus Gastranaerophilales bacterium]|nr:DNA polymerase III subunit delta [Candidatus Gastranaerophilales bacterium]